MATIQYPKTLFGPGGQTKKVLSKQAEAALGPEWKASRELASPTTEYPMLVYKGSESKVVKSKEEAKALGDGWFESLNEKNAAEAAKTSKP